MTSNGIGPHNIKSWISQHPLIWSFSSFKLGPAAAGYFKIKANSVSSWAWAWTGFGKNLNKIHAWINVLFAISSFPLVNLARAGYMSSHWTKCSLLMAFCLFVFNWNHVKCGSGSRIQFAVCISVCLTALHNFKNSDWSNAVMFQKGWAINAKLMMTCFRRDEE